MQFLFALSDKQSALLKWAAAPIPRRMGAHYLERVAALLQGRAVGNAELRRACAAAQAELLRLYDCSPGDLQLSSRVRDPQGPYPYFLVRYVPNCGPDCARR